MLRKLHIQNYAIIDALEINFSNNLNAITGETGAGKSILMGALSLILGERADSSALQNREKKCIVEGFFSIDNKIEVKGFLLANELDQEDDLLIIRREIAVSGKSRAFINDTPATLQQLKQVASLLVDLHQQFDTLELGDTDFQRQVVDALAGNTDALETYQQHYKNWVRQQKELDVLLSQKENFKKESDYHHFVFNELEQLSLQENELEEIELELKLLSNAEEIKTTLARAYFDLQESEQPVVQQLKIISNQLQGFAGFHANLPTLIARIQSTQVELQDIADEVDQLNNHIHYDQQKIELLNERISTGYRLLKKHNVKTTNELIDIKNDLENKLQAVLNIDETIVIKQKEVEALLQLANERADALTRARQKISEPLANQVNALLVQVGMPNAQMKVQLTPAHLHIFGNDSIEFLFDANKSNRFEPIRKVASGGELSRLMLCIKSLVAQSIDLPTLIFDEIDSGISGEAARQVGNIMKQLSDKRQVIAITHQPQIAGKASAHFFVYKEIKGDAIKTNIRLLTKDERITTIAQMLSGEKPTAAALQNAREMVSN